MMLSILVVLLVAPRADIGQVATLLNQDRATSDAVHRNGLVRGLAPAFALADRAFAQMAADSGAPAAFAAFAAPMWAPLFAGASASGDLGYTVGEASITAPNGATYFSKYLTVWRRTPDGAVRFIVDGGNERPRNP